jgi:hypothetical protein
MLIARGLRLGLLDPSLREKEKERGRAKRREMRALFLLSLFFL